MAVVQLADVIVPDEFTAYTQQLTEEKSRLIVSGAVVRDPAIDALLAGGGLLFSLPSWNDLDNSDEDIVNDDPTDESAPDKVGSSLELAVRLSRHKSWSSMALSGILAGADPLAAIGNRVASYWNLRTQALFVATMRGLFADNAAAPSGTEHTINDLTHDIKGGAYSAGVTDFSAAAVLDAALTMGDSQDDLKMVFMHSVVFNRAQKLNLIDFVPDATGTIQIPRYLGRTVVVDDGMPAAGGVFETWLFGPGAVRWGVGSPATPTEVARVAAAGNGGGQDTLHNRVEWCMHPTGHKYAGTPANGGPSNAATANNLANASSWQRVYPERKQIKIARLITRES